MGLATIRGARSGPAGVAWMLFGCCAWEDGGGAAFGSSGIGASVVRQVQAHLRIVFPAHVGAVADALL